MELNMFIIVVALHFFFIEFLPHLPSFFLQKFSDFSLEQFPKNKINNNIPTCGYAGLLVSNNE